MPGWIIDSKANFIELTANGKTRENLRFLRFLWSFVRSNYLASSAKKIKVKDLMKNIQMVSKDESKKVLVKDFYNFIKSFQKEEILTEENLKSWPL